MAANPLGVFALLGRDVKLKGKAAWTSDAKGVRVRAAIWTTITGDGIYDWTYADDAVKYASENGKQLGFSWASLSIDKTEQKWLLDLGVKTVTLSDEDPKRPGLVIILPSDPTFQRIIKAFLLEAGKRYDGKFTCSQITGLGQPASESYMARTAADEDILKAAGFGPDEWTDSSLVISSYHFDAFKKTKLIFTASYPFTSREGKDALKPVLDSLAATYGAQFGVMNSGLNSKSNADGTFAADNWIAAHATTNPCGFQMLSGSNDARLGGLQAAIDAGIKMLKGHGFQELYEVEFKPENAQLLKDSNLKLGATTQ